MTEFELSNEYFDWMCQLVCTEKYGESSHGYFHLMAELNNIDFQYSIPMDGNREIDGIDLRYRFGYEMGYEDAVIANLLDIRPCSVLEMMVALAFRCEEHIMADPDIGNRTVQWFWEMIVSLGLNDMDDWHYDRIVVEETIGKFLNHEYEPDGRGGLFTVPDCQYDMRSLEIWSQMNGYLATIR